MICFSNITGMGFRLTQNRTCQVYSSSSNNLTPTTGMLKKRSFEESFEDNPFDSFLKDNYMLLQPSIINERKWNSTKT